MFFFKRHYSTAQKIINHVEEKLLKALKKNPAAKKYRKLASFYEEEPVISIINKHNLVKILGDALQDTLPDYLYNKYQHLPESEKQVLRELIIEEYFKSLLSVTHCLENIEIKFPYGAKFRWDYRVCAEISLPEEFLNKEHVARILQETLPAILRTINKPETESVLKFRERSL